MISRPSVVSSLVALPLQSLLPRPLVVGLVVLSLCAGLARFTQPDLTPRLLGRIWGALPTYSLVVRGGDACLRCLVVDSGIVGSGVRLDAPLDIALRPEQPVAGPVFVHAFLRHAGRLTTWPVVMERSTDGALLLGGMARDLLDLPAGARGRYELIFIVQRSPVPPSYAVVQARLKNLAAGTDPQLLRSDVDILAPAVR